MHKLPKILTIATLLISAICMQPAIVQAQTTPSASASASATPLSPLNLTVSPVSLSLETQPGIPVQAALKIRNNSEQMEQLAISFGTFTADETGQKPRLLDPKAGDSFMSWLTVDQPNIVVQPGEWKTLTLTFAPPAEAALSYYYTVVVNRVTPSERPGETAIKGAPAILVLTTVNSPNTQRQLELVEFSAQWPIVEFLPQTFKIGIKNSGNVHVSPIGNIFIDGQGQKDLAVLSLNPVQSSVLPQSTRTLEVAWDAGFPLDLKKTTQPPTATGVTFWSTWWDLNQASHFRLGKYTAHLLMVYDNGERDVPIESFVSFWVIPWRLALVGIILFGLVMVGLRSVMLKVLSWFKRMFSVKSP